MVPRGEYLLTLKAQGELIEGSIEELREEPYLTRTATQYLIDFLWEADRLPTLNQLHHAFYKQLRSQGFRAHQAEQIYKYALSTVKSAKNNGGKKPVLKKLTARLDKYDADVDLENQIVTIKLRSRVFKIKLLYNKSYTRKFIGRKWYEVTISVDRRGRIWVNIPFRWEYNPYRFKRLVSLDVNLRKVVIYDVRNIRRINTRYTGALSLKIHAEKIQKKYPRMWRYNERILCRIRELHRRSRNIVVDRSRKFAKYIILKARRTGSAIVLEDLNRLWSSASRKSSTIADKLSRFAYRKLQHAIIAKAVEYNVPVVYVNPRNTSRTCLKCGSPLRYWHRLAVRRRCSFKAGRDTVGAINLYLRLRDMYIGVRGRLVGAARTLPR